MTNAQRSNSTIPSEEVFVTAVPTDGGAIAVTFTAGARPGLLALFAGVLTLCDLDIGYASITLRADATVEDRFVVTPLGGGTDATHDAMRVRATLAAVQSGKVDLRSALRSRRAVHPLDAEASKPSVEFDCDSEFTTGFRVRAADRPGLLHDLAAVLADAGLRTRSLTVLTVAGMALDTFRVVDSTGAAPADEMMLRRVADRLAAACA